MVRVKWMLRSFLREHGLSVQDLIRAMGGKQEATLYRLTSPTDPPSSVDLPTLGVIISTLRRMTGEDVQLTDILEAVEVPEHETDDLQLWRDAEIQAPLEPDGHGKLDPTELGEPLRYEPDVGWVSREEG